MRVSLLFLDFISYWGLVTCCLKILEWKFGIWNASMGDLMGTSTGGGGGGLNSWPPSAVCYAWTIFSLMSWPSQTLCRELGFFANSLCQYKPSLLYLCLSCCRKGRRRTMLCNPEKKSPRKSHLNALSEKPPDTRYCFVSIDIKICESCSRHTCVRLGWTTWESPGLYPIQKSRSYFSRATSIKQQRA